MEMRSAPALLEDAAAAVPDCVWFEETGAGSLTFAEAARESARWAAALRQLGVGDGDRVVTMMPSGTDSVLAWFGLAYLRAVDTGCNAAYLGDMLSYIITNSRAAVMIVSERYAGRLAGIDTGGLKTVVVPDASGPLPDVPGVRLMDRAAFLGPAAAEPPAPPAPAAWDLACVTYTSGTTGPSKGVLVPWGQICAQVAGLFDDFGPDDTVYSIFPAFHLSYRFCIYLSLQRRGRFVARDGFSGSQFWDDIRRYRATATGLTGTMANFLAQLPARADDADNPVRELLSFPLPADHARFAERFGVRLRTCFTSTEICVPIVTDPSGRIDDPASCGRVRAGWPGIEVRLVDANDIAVPPGEMGELVVRTAVPWTMNAGYLDQPGATAAAWRNGWFHTGDCLRQAPSGDFYFVDRVKDALRRRGENISSFEVESFIRRHPAVKDVAVIGVPSELGEDEVYAIIETVGGQPLDPAGLTGFLRPIMPAFMLPRFVDVVPELPRTEATLRVRKAELRARGRSASAWDAEAG
jgi:crotonobetaine/carnitine-CoA ligase